MQRPKPTEYPEYYSGYVGHVPDGDICEILEDQLTSTLALLGSIDEATASHRYEPGKWSITEMVGHVVDAERVFALRALCFARQDAAALPGFEQDDYVVAANFETRGLQDLATEFEHLRKSNVVLFRSFDDATSQRTGIANEAEITVRAIVYIIAGHERHHVNVLRDRYLSTL